MKQALLSCITVVVCLGMLLAAAPDSPSLPQYTSDNQLLRPEGYREWIYLSSGLGMNYSPVAGHEMFTNVFVPQWAYQEFLKSGKWPDKSMFVVEERGSQSKGSINSRFPDKWAYFNFDEDTKAAKANPKAGCWQCHEDHAAVEHTFVQFYPTLKPVAKKFGTYKQGTENGVK